MKRNLALILALLFAGAAADAEERIDHDVIARIKAEGFQRSAVMETLGMLTDVHGPRLSGSPGLRNAQQWCRDRLTAWGLSGVALEPYGEFGSGWSLERFSIEMLEPSYMRIVAHPKAWSPPTPHVLTGTPVAVEVAGKDDFDRYRGTLKGAIVMNGRPGPAVHGFEPEARRLDPDELRTQEQQIDPAADRFDGPRSYWDENREWQEHLKEQEAITAFFRSEGIAALLEPSQRSQGVVRVAGFYDRQTRSTYPAFVLAREHYGRIWRLLERKVPVKVELSLASRFHDDDTTGYNVIGEIPGTDPALKEEVVMLGAHLDSWESGTGATDNAAGSAVVMEAVRILKAIGVDPRRTIRVALWSGEEQGYYGSVGYVERHFGDPKTLDLKPEHAGLSGYFNLDNGAGRIRGVNLQGNEAARPIFEEFLRPFNYLDASTVTTLNTGGTDHMPFDALSLPGFQFIQDPLAYGTRTHHTHLDVYESVIEDDLKQAAVVMAGFVYHTAMRDGKLPRKPLVRPTPKGDR